MTEERIKQVLVLARLQKSELVVVTKNKTRTYIDFNNEEYDDTFVNDKVEAPCLYVWNTTFNHWNIIPLESIDFFEFY